MLSYFPVALALASSLLLNAGAAPTASLDAATLLSNAQRAQKANAQFSSLQATDSCNDDQIACISNSIAQCVNGTFKAQERCLKSQSCFALPNVKEDGIIISCTSEKKALSVITASGANGGINGSDASTGDSSTADSTSVTQTASSTKVKSSPSATVALSSSSNAPLPTVVDLPGAESGNDSQGGLYHTMSEDESSSTPPTSIPSSSASISVAVPTITPAPSASVSSDPGKVVVTVTVTLGTGATTLSPQTTLLSPEAAAKAISSLLQEEGATLVSDAVSATAATASPSGATEAAATPSNMSSGGYGYR